MMEPIDVVGEIDETAEPVQRRVAVLIMVVTLLGAGVLFLQTQAGNRERAANRRSEAHSLQTLGALVDAGQAFARRDAMLDLSYEFYGQSIYLRPVPTIDGSADDYTLALADANEAASSAIGANAMRTVGYDLAPAAFEHFFVDQYRPSYAAIEYEKAYARQRDDWGAKSSQYIAVITALALALFLLGLALTVASVARRLFIAVGTAICVLTAAWASVIWLRAVEGPSAVAVETYARGQAKMDSLGIATGDKADFDEVISDMTAAIDARPEYLEAYLTRGVAYFEYDLSLRPGGPRGSTEARNDWQKVVELDPGSFPGWVDLGAAQFWLGDYPAALASTRRALDIDNDEAISNLNYALFLIVSGDRARYERQMERARSIISSAPSWLRDAVMVKYQVVIDKGIRYRPPIAPAVRVLEEDLVGMVHEIDVSTQMNGTPDPPPVGARADIVAFDLSDDRRTLKVQFNYTGMEAGQPWLYHTYVDEQREDNLSHGPEPFDDSRFRVPDGGVILSLPRPTRFRPGQKIRVEIFVEGNLIGVGEFTTPSG